MATTLTADQLSSSLDLTEKTILLPVETDAVTHYADRSDFPTTGRLKRLYVAEDTGVLWAWTGTTYAKTSPTVSEHTSLAGDVAIAEAALITIQSSASTLAGRVASTEANIASATDRVANTEISIQALQITDTGLDSRISANETAIAITLPGLITDAEGFEQLDSFADFPETGRLNRLYLDRGNGTLWRWTGTTYSPVPGEQDGGTY